MNSKSTTHSRFSHHSMKSTLVARKVAAAVLVCLSGTMMIGGSPAIAATTPAEGGGCETLGSRAPGTSLDCVATPGGQTWRTKGTRLNPFRIGETATIERFVGAAWSPSYKFTVTGGNPDATADVTLTKGAIDKGLVPTGWRAVSAGVIITHIGRKPAPSAGLKSFFVDSTDKAYPLYAFRKGEIDCSAPYAKQVNEAKLTQNNGTITGNVCTFVNAASVNSTLLMRIVPAQTKTGVVRETWFAFL